MTNDFLSLQIESEESIITRANWGLLMGNYPIRLAMNKVTRAILERSDIIFVSRFIAAEVFMIAPDDMSFVQKANQYLCNSCDDNSATTWAMHFLLYSKQQESINIIENMILCKEKSWAIKSIVDSCRDEDGIEKDFVSRLLIQRWQMERKEGIKKKIIKGLITISNEIALGWIENYAVIGREINLRFFILDQIKRRILANKYDLNRVEIVINELKRDANQAISTRVAELKAAVEKSRKR